MQNTATWQMELADIISIITVLDKDFHVSFNWLWIVRIWDLILILSAIFLFCQARVTSVFHTVPTLTIAAWSEYCVDALFHWLFSGFYLLTIHFSHLCRSMWDIQMLAPQYLQRSKCLLVPWGIVYIHRGRIYCYLFR